MRWTVGWTETLQYQPNICFYLSNYLEVVPPHGLRKLKVTPNQFLRVRFTRLVRPVNQMCTKCSHDRYSDCIAPKRNHYRRYPTYPKHHRVGHTECIRYFMLSFDREMMLVFVNRELNLNIVSMRGCIVV